MKRNIWRSLALFACIAAPVSVLGFMGGVNAAPQGGQLPFRNAVEQREDMLRELQEIKLLLKEQNALLRTMAPKGPFDASKKP